MPKTGFAFEEIFLKHQAPPGHPECKERLEAIVSALKSSDIWESLVKIGPRKATQEELLAVHSPGHVERMRKIGRGYADPDTYISDQSHEAALHAAGAPLEAIDMCRSGDIERAFCAVRPPGHHAEADRAMGFCLFNNVAVAARYAQRCGYERVFIIDFDVHHGNGTQHIFDDDDSVFYLSTHQWPHYPGTGANSETGNGRGEGFTANFPMPAGSGDKEYFTVYNDVLPGIVEKFSPGIMLVSAGYDMLSSDPLAQIRVTEEGIRAIVGGILASAEVPAVFCLEGGYDVRALSSAVVLTIRILAGQK